MIEESAAVEGVNAPEAEAAAAPATIEGEDEENIYEVMKGHMRRQKEELEAKSAQLRQQRVSGPGGGGPAGYGRPGPVAPPTAPVIQKVSDVTDMNAVWAAVRTYLASAARYLDSVLGHCCRMESLDQVTGDAVLMVPANQKGFTNEKARAKIEEAVRAVTGLPVKLAVRFGEEEARAAAADHAGASTSGGGVAQRVPADVVEAVKAQPIVKQLMKKLDANVTNIELQDTGNAE